MTESWGIFAICMLFVGCAVAFCIWNSFVGTRLILTRNQLEVMKREAFRERLHSLSDDDLDAELAGRIQSIQSKFEAESKLPEPPR